MNVWAVTMVKDEEDIIEYTIRQLLALGVAGIIVADNMSSDETPLILATLAREAPIYYFQDKEVAFYQGDKMTALYDLARFHGAEWVIPFDADECWTGGFAELEKAATDALTVPVWDHIATDSDSNDPNPIKRMGRILGRGPNKVIVRAKEGLRISQGNHMAFGPDARVIETVPSVRMKIHHFPYRSEKQFIRKMKNGGAALAVTDLPESLGIHWRKFGAMSETELGAYYRKELVKKTEVSV